jgi:heptosyltransferase II
VCDQGCTHLDIPRTRIVMVHLEALGAVLRSTALLPAIKRKFPSSHITWVTKAPAHNLLQNNPLVDRILNLDAEGVLALELLEFDIGFCLDKSLAACGLVQKADPDLIYGFRVDRSTGAILPATPAANELWELGLNNHKKFFVNKKPETQLAAEALELNYRRDTYSFYFTANESSEIQKRRARWGEPVIGLNTGCNSTIAAKKLTVAAHKELVRKLSNLGQVVLLGGGPEDEQRNSEIAKGSAAVESSCRAGLRDGMISVAACDIVVSGDSLGLHMAVALQKWVVAWFGPTCEQEIDLFGRGVKIQTQAKCSPCWLRECSRDPMCYDQVSLDEIVGGVAKGLAWLTSSYKPPISEISSSPSP